MLDFAILVASMPREAVPQKNWRGFRLIDSCFEFGGVEPGKSSYRRVVKPLWNIMEHIRMILWNFLALPQCWNIYAPRRIVEKTNMIRYSFARRCHIKTRTQGIILVKNPSISYHCISFLASLTWSDLIWFDVLNDTVRSLSGSQRQNYTICILDLFGGWFSTFYQPEKSWRKVVSPHID